MKSISKPSKEVIKRYKDKAIMKIAFDLPKATGEAFKEKCKTEGIPQAQVLKQAINDFLSK